MTGGCSLAAAAATPSTLPAEEPEHYYVVKKGDYIWALARRFNFSAFQLLRANNLTWDAILRIGQRLVIPSRFRAYGADEFPSKCD